MSLDLQLNPPFIALIATNQINPIPIETQDKDLQFGSVYKINYDSMHVDVGAVVLFNKSKAKMVNQLTQSYFIVDESEVLFTQNPAL